ncbi:MAG: hypothetical protein AAF203_04940 [Pseudomonadota bacterium]
MEIKKTDIMSFLEPEETGFIYDTARSFLKRHSNPESLMAQLKSLVARGQLSACRDMIQLIIREGHSLGDSSEIYLLRAQIAFEQSGSKGDVMTWVQQAKMANPKCEKLQSWETLIEGVNCLDEGDYQKGETLLKTLSDNEEVAGLAQYQLAHHYFWRNIDGELSMAMLEDLCMNRPEFTKAWSCLGFVYNRLGMKDKAQEAFGLCLENETNPEKIAFYKQQLAS